MTQRTRLARAAGAALSAALLAGCAEVGGLMDAGPLEYAFDEPASGPRAGRDRIRGIDEILRGPACRSAGNAGACGSYAMEAGLIYTLVERQEIEGDNMLRRAYDFQATCDLRILRANAVAKAARRRGELSEAVALMAGAGGRCDGTAARYYAAKLDILSDDENRVRAGRARLAELSAYSLGNSGVAAEDVYTLGVYSFVSNAEFAEAKRLLREAGDRGIEVSPRLQALALIGGGAQDGFALPAGAAVRARAYIDRRVEEYRFGAAIDEFVRAAGRIDGIAAAPWEEVEARMAADPNLTESQRAIVRMRVADEFARLGDEIAAIDEARTRLAAYGPGLAAAEKRFVTAAVAAAFGAGGAEELDRSREEYMTELRRLSGALERINGAIGDMGGMQELHAMLADPDAYLRAADAADAIAADAARLAGDDADAAVLRGFAAAVSRTLSPEEFFRAWEVNLDSLGFESEPVVRNVRRVMTLAGGSV